MKENRKLLKEVLKDIRHDMTDEEVLNLLADSKISVSPESGKEKYTLGQRAADTIAKFAGSWAFIFSFTGVLILWMIVNTVLASKAFDPYPFILLNLVLSCVAAIQAPLIMMSQNRQEEKDRRRAENDYKVNLKTEIMIEDLYDKEMCIRDRYPDGEFTKEELEEVIQIALEMRRRVKEQLKKLGGMEFYDVNFSYIDLDDMSEHYVSVPEQGGGKLIPDGMCNPGQVYTCLLYTSRCV